jgi:hypothetical protein
MLDKLERKLRRFAVPNVTLLLIACQVVVYVMAEFRSNAVANIQLVPRLVLEGQFWRLFTFVVEPPPMNVLFAFFFWYLFYLMGSALEQQWGAFRYNVFLLIGYFATVAAAFLTPDVPATNGFVQGTVFLAFAYLFPDFELTLFFILPVKVKWLALIQWAFYGLTFVTGEWSTRAAIAASVLNFFVFFGKDLYLRIKGKRRRMAWQAKTVAEKEKPFHRCLVCGITDKTHPEMDFRYCSKCAGACGYCTEHIRSHEHVTEAEGAVEAG